MSKAINTKQLERLVHQSFHDLADKYDMDVDLIAEISIGELNEKH